MFRSVLPSLSSLLRGLSPFPSSSPLSSRVSKKDLEEIHRIIDDLEELEQKWEGLLNDAEKRQMHGESVQSWLSQVRDLADEILDLCDVYEYEVVAREMESSSEHSSSSTDAAASEIERPEELDDEGRSSVMSYVSPLLDANFRLNISDGLRRIREKISTIENLRNEESKGGPEIGKPEEFDDEVRPSLMRINEKFGPSGNLRNEEYDGGDFGMDSSIGASVGSLLQRLNINSPSSASSSLRQDEQAEVNRIVQDLEDVKKDWRWFQVILADAEERQIHEKSVQIWLRDLRYLAYQIEDLLDVYEYEVVAREVEASRAPSSSGDASISKKRKLGEPYVEVRHSMITSLSPLLDASFRDQIARDVKRIKVEFDFILNQRKALHLKEADGRMYSSGDGVYKREPTGHFPTDPVFLGRDREMEQLREMLLADHGDRRMDVEVIAVIGIGGVGKTTLAQHVCSDPEVVGNFDKIGWVHVSETFDVICLTKAVIETFSIDSSPNRLSLLQNELERLIKDKKVLIVMDDVWNIESWDSFVAPFYHGAKKGSRILVTTRLPELVNGVRAVRYIMLGNLSEEDGWSLLQKYAFPNQRADVANLGELERIGKRIAAKCLGLPLSFTVLGHLLRSMGNDEIKWKVLEYKFLEHGVTEFGMILESLYLSYLYLSPKLKSCFKFFAFYPKKKIPSIHLKYSWMAHGLVKDEREARNCLYELESRSFICLNFDESFDSRSAELIYMNDYFYDLAQFISGEQYQVFNYDDTSFAEQVTEVDFLGSRHVSLHYQDLSHKNTDITLSTVRTLKFEDSYRVVNVHMSPGQCLHELDIRSSSLEVTSHDGCQNHFKCLRILILNTARGDIPQWVYQLYNLRYLKLCNIVSEGLSDYVCDLRHLQSLNIVNSNIIRLPEAMSKLTNLQELNLTNSGINCLPNSTSKLVNLQELNLYGCWKLHVLPEGLTNLTNLRSLDLRYTCISYMPKGFGALTKLEYLTYYVIDSKCAGLADLKSIRKLKDTILIENLCEVGSEEDAAQAEMASKKHLHKLFLRWTKFAHKGCLKLSEVNPFLSRYVSDHVRSERVKFQLKGGNEDKVALYQEQVFEQLKPHSNIDEVFTSDYKGYKLPSWMGHESFTKLVRLQLHEINYCTSLSPIDQLPSLDVLVLESMDRLKHLTSNQSSGHANIDIMHPAIEQCQSFPKLRQLHIYHCKSLELLPLCKFISLEDIKVHGCLNFERMEPPYHNPCPLKTIDIEGCPKFEFSPEPHFPQPSWELRVHLNYKCYLEDNEDMVYSEDENILDVYDMQTIYSPEAD